MLEKKISLEEIENENHNTGLLEFIDGPKFDLIVDTILRYMFRTIVFIGIPYFIYIMKDIVTF